MGEILNFTHSNSPDRKCIFLKAYNALLRHAFFAVYCKKIESLGWKPNRDLFNELPNIVEWYKRNYKIFKKIKK